jgi:hypothetical protein
MVGPPFPLGSVPGNADGATLVGTLQWCSSGLDLVVGPTLAGTVLEFGGPNGIFSGWSTLSSGQVPGTILRCLLEHFVWMLCAVVFFWAGSGGGHSRNLGRRWGALFK